MQFQKSENCLIPTSDYPYFGFKFGQFNPVQTSCFKYYNQDCNFVLSASMASGKTTIAEMIIGYELVEKEGFVFYASPLCAISDQMRNDWEKNKILGYHLNPHGSPLDSGRRLHIGTIEGIDVIIRKNESVFKNVTCLILDEAHILSDEDRGSNAESLIMRVTEINPDCRIIFLSGTLSNAKEIAGWLKSLNNKSTYFVKSDWRPIELNKEYKVVKPDSTYKEVLKVCSENKYDKILVFTHSKKQGKEMKKFLYSNGIDSDFFSSDLNSHTSKKMIESFKSDKFDVLIATTALSMGINL